jgi:amidase
VSDRRSASRPALDQPVVARLLHDPNLFSEDAAREREIVVLHRPGHPAFKDYVADADATVVRRLKQAGAIVVGKTNVHFMLADFGQTANELYGVTNNPWDTGRTPGGSSGGGAAALAAGLTFLDYGSDLVGSIRIPASFCGIYGLKPSVGIVPLTGFQPPGPPAGPSGMTYMSAVGPLGRSATDLRTALAITAGPELPAANAYKWRLAPPRHERLEEFRVGVVLDHEHAPVSSAVASPLSDAVDALARAGASVVQGWPEGVDPAAVAESFGLHVGLFFAYKENEPFAQASKFVEPEQRRMAVRAAWRAYFANIDAFVCPVNFTPAFPHDNRPFDERTISTAEGERPYDSQSFWIAHASLAGLPAVAAPIGTTRDGLPVGAQIIGPLYEDDTVLTFAESLPPSWAATSVLRSSTCPLAPTYPVFTCAASRATGALLVTPRTLLRWHQAMVRRKCVSRAAGVGRPPLSAEIRDLALRPARENPGWGHRRICGELAKLGLRVSPTSIRRLLAHREARRGAAGARARTGGSCCEVRRRAFVACDFFTVESVFLRRYYVLFFIAHASRRVWLAGCTRNPHRRVGDAAGAQPRPRPLRPGHSLSYSRP